MPGQYEASRTLCIATYVHLCAKRDLINNKSLGFELICTVHFIVGTIVFFVNNNL